MNAVRENVHHATGWLDDKLVPILGPATLGPYELDERDDPEPGVADTLCPVCHHAMSRHEVDVDPRTHHVFLCCPGTGVEMETDRHVELPHAQVGPVLD